MNLRWPSSKKLPHPPGARGEELRPDDERSGLVDDGLLAFAERVAQARSLGPEGRAGDFEQLGRRRWRDKATGQVYRRIAGCRRLGSPALQDVDVSFVAEGVAFGFRRSAPRR